MPQSAKPTKPNTIPALRTSAASASLPLVRNGLLDIIQVIEGSTKNIISKGRRFKAKGSNIKSAEATAKIHTVLRAFSSPITLGKVVLSKSPN